VPAKRYRVLKGDVQELAELGEADMAKPETLTAFLKWGAAAYPAKRTALTREILTIHMADVGHIPLHHQVIPWAMRSNVTVVHRADNRLTVKWVRIQ